MVKRAVTASGLAVGIALVGPGVVPLGAQTGTLDTATATGSSGNGAFSNINISASSTPTGQNPSGSVKYDAFNFGTTFHISGPVTCMSVTGPDRGAGKPGSPTTAVINDVEDSTASLPGQVVTTQLVDNGGGGLDIMSAAAFQGRTPTDCSPLLTPNLISPLSNGRAIVFDAPPCNPNAQNNQNQNGNDQGCTNP